MTREHAKKILTHLRNGKSDLMLMDALDMAISALSESDNVGMSMSHRAIAKVIGDYIANNKGNVIKQYTAYEIKTLLISDDSDNKGEWIDNGNGSYACSNCKTEWTTSQIEKMCFCPTCGNPKVREGDKAE